MSSFRRTFKTISIVIFKPPTGPFFEACSVLHLNLSQ